jgi:hypothetical protein
MCPASGVLQVTGFEQPGVLELPEPVTFGKISARVN